MIWGRADVIIIQKVHNKCNALESSWNNPHPHPRPPSLPGPWKNCPPWNQSLVPKRSGTTDLEVLNGTSEYFLFQLFYCTCINISHTSFFYKNWIVLGILYGKIFCSGGFFFFVWTGATRSIPCNMYENRNNFNQFPLMDMFYYYKQCCNKHLSPYVI